MNGAESPATQLLRTARSGLLHHALILHGPSDALLRETAMALAKALNCLNESLGDDCASCSKIGRGSHPDVEMIEIGEERKMIAVEQIRDLVNRASLRPYEGRSKVFVIPHAEAMSVGGANALLKTLEEPVRDTVFLLLTRSSDLLLPTIRSRSQSVQIREVTGSGRQRAGGSLQLRRMSAMFQSMETRELQRSVRLINETLAAFATTTAAAPLLGLAASLGGEEEGAEALALYAATLRDLVSLAPEDSENPDEVRAIQAAITREQLLRSADIALRAVQRLVVNVDLRLVFEQAVAALVRRN